MKPAEDYHISAGFGTFHEICPYKEKLERIDSLFAELEIPLPYDLWLAESLQIRERLKKRIKEIRKLLENTKLTKEESMELQYWLRENTMARGEEK